MVSLALLGSDGSSITASCHKKAIFEGRFKVKNIEFAETIADRIEELNEFYKNSNRRSFVFAIIRLMKRKQFDYAELVHKLKMQPNSLVDCTNTEKYIELIEEIYNYRRTNKINLRF
jgi:alpha-acetolactate decarboxylase